MSNGADPDPRPAPVLRLPPLVQLVVVAGLALYAATALRGLLSPPSAGPGGPPPRQSVYVLGPKGGSLPELQSLLDSGWRVAMMSTSRSTVGTVNTTNVGLVLENGKMEQHLALTHIDGPAARDSALQALDAKLKEGWRIAQLSAAAAPAGGEGASVTVFVLERHDGR